MELVRAPASNNLTRDAVATLLRVIEVVHFYSVVSAFVIVAPLMSDFPQSLSGLLATVKRKLPRLAAAATRRSSLNQREA
jgi:hypothetical protein